MSSDSVRGQGIVVPGDEFRRACGRFSTGITIASVADSSGTPHGLTVNSFTAVSLAPPLILICLAHSGTLIEIFRAAKYFGINVLTESQRKLSDRFARKGQDRFDGLEWAASAHGVPLLPGVLATFECRVERQIPAGDHDIFIGAVEALAMSDGEPLVYFSSRYRRLLPAG